MAAVKRVSCSLTLVEKCPVLCPQEKSCCMAGLGNGTLALTNMNCLLIHFVRNFAQPISQCTGSHRSAICASSASSWPPRLCRRPVPTGAGPAADGGADVDAATGGGEGAAVEMWRECLPWRPSHDWRR